MFKYQKEFNEWIEFKFDYIRMAVNWKHMTAKSVPNFLYEEALKCVSRNKEDRTKVIYYLYRVIKSIKEERLKLYAA